MKTETLRNGIPLDVRWEPYSFDTTPLPIKRGDEARISTPSGSFHVVLLAGTGRKRWLVRADTLRAYLRADADLKINGPKEVL